MCKGSERDEIERRAIERCKRGGYVARSEQVSPTPDRVPETAAISSNPLTPSPTVARGCLVISDLKPRQVSQQLILGHAY